MVSPSIHMPRRTKFFLIAPELARLSAEDSKEISGTTPAKEGNHHHTLSASVISREENNLEKLVTTLENFTNPFIEQSNDLFTALFNNTRTLKLKAQPTNAFFAAVNQVFGGSS